MTPAKNLTALLVTSLLLAACTSAPRETAQAPAPAATPKSENKQNLRKGMTEAEIRAVWGEPKSSQPGKAEGETILIYHFDVLTTQRMVAATVAEVTAVDPINGATRTVLEPVLSPQNVTITQTIVLQLKEGKLASWARQLGEERAFN
jgi:hypothetical protein